MTTALQIINRAYGAIGYKATGEVLSGEDASEALDVLNSMVDGWNTQRLFIAEVANVVGTVSGASATVGTGLTFNTPNPVDIEAGGFVRVNGVDYPLELIDRQTYEGLALKTVSSTYPQYAYFYRGVSSSNVYFYPAASGAVEVHLPFQVQLAEFADLTTDYSLAQGYRLALQLSLAEELAMGVREVPALLARKAANARRVIRRSNVEVPLLDVMPSGVRFNIYSGL